MHRTSSWTTFTASIAIAASALAQAPAPAPATTAPPAATGSSAAPATGTAAVPRAAPAGYLAPNAVDMLAVLPPAPRAGDARYESDRRIFKETRALEGTPRWKMAADDAEIGTAAMLQHFSCSLDIELTPQQAPRLVAVLQKATRDAAQAMVKAKDFYKRQRPYLIDAGNTCVARETVGNSYDYPSGHTTAGWAWGLTLAQVAPEHATAILVRGRAIGDSRIVCGMHNATAVDAARLLTGATLVLVTAMPEYQADLAAARVELAGLRAAPHGQPAAARCAEEAALVKIP